MTWNEFKEAVDAELERLGWDGEIEVDFIDVMSLLVSDIRVRIKNGELIVE